MYKHTWSLSNPGAGRIMNVDEEEDDGGFSPFNKTSNKNSVIKYAPLSHYYNPYSNDQLTVQIVAKWIEERIDLRKLWCVDKALEELRIFLIYYIQ